VPRRVGAITASGTSARERRHAVESSMRMGSVCACSICASHGSRGQEWVGCLGAPLEKIFVVTVVF
jgi:hypothetical protein